MMTGKRESDDKDWHAGRSEPNLGQKAAELEKGSEAALRHMEGVPRHVSTWSVHRLVQARASES